MIVLPTLFNGIYSKDHVAHPVLAAVSFYEYTYVVYIYSYERVETTSMKYDSTKVLL